MTPSRDLDRLAEIMSALRDPQTGCPWDLEQTFATIAPYTIEEAYEVADAIERDDAADLCEELGDLLLQVVYHAQLASEAGHFDLGDVVEGITAKMIRRHPHVFGDAVERSAGGAENRWDAIKAEEKAERTRRRAAMGTRSLTNGTNGQAEPVPPAQGDAGPSTGLLSEVPNAFPALTLALKIQKKAAKVGFDWDAPEPIRAKIDEELSEFTEAVRSSHTEDMQRELGDILFSIVNLARYYGLDPEAGLRSTVVKFRRRFGYVEREIVGRGESLESASLEAMEALWQRAKIEERSTR